jgi:hypothetical protein
MRIPWFLLVVLFCAFSLVSMGCTARKKEAIAPESVEPDTEWIMAQYRGQNEATVNKRRIQEGW